ncbi:MAG: M23 family metallopeptidase [Bacilli bacterium]|nr:M23 family metallopeptidase [Bacilli bacterium]MDD4282925.1 M23 family metallopeptidase [Bacilli bacterium]
MSNRKLKKEVVYAGYVVGFLLFIGLIYVIETSISKNMFKPVDDDYDYVSKTIVEDEVPVVNVGQVITKPFVESEIKILKGYYDYLADNKKQETAIIYHSGTYFQNSGVDYGGKESFSVVAILDGTVIDVKEDNLLGKTIEINHNNEIISIYQSLGEVKVKKEDIVKQGDIIGTSGSDNLSKDLGDHLHFEFIYKGQALNPEEYYEKELGDL